MLTYQRHVLKARVGTLVGSALLLSWAVFCGLAVWRASFGTDPLTQTFTAALTAERGVMF